MAFSFGQPAATGGATAGAGAGTGTGTAPGTSTPSFSFGAPPQSQQPQQGSSLFGQQAQQPQQQQQQQQQQQPQQQGSSLFGGGAQQQAGSSLFGNNQTQPQQQPQQQQGSSLFGQQPQQGQSSSLFGQQPQQGQSGSLFGQQPQQGQSSSLFGQQPQQQQGGALGTSSLFGKPMAGGTSSLFGQPQQQQSQQIGQGQAQAGQSLTLGSFGTVAPYSQSGQQQLQAGQGGLFASGANGTVAMTAGQARGTSAQQQQTQEKRLGVPVNDKLEAIRAAWDLQNIQTCQFLYYFYNSIPSEPAHLGEAALSNPNFGRRQDATGSRHDALWLQTLRENPDRAKLVPVLAVGFPDLKSRIEAQQAETARQSNKLEELQKRLDELNSKNSLSNSVRISAISRKQTSLHQRLVALAKRIHVLIPALRGQSITGKEEQLKNLLNACEMELASISSLSNDGGLIQNGTAGDDKTAMVHHRLRGRINELWALLGTVKAKREADAMTGDRSRLEWAVVDEGAVEDIAKILGAQQQGLDHLSTTLQSDTRALDTIVKGLEGVELIGAN